jgi:23S rRNA-/tRNA-specific pseudouridylate synthase
MITKPITSDHVGKRLDEYCLEQLPELNRSFVQKLIVSNKITVNSEQMKTGYKLRVGDTITIDYDKSQYNTFPDINLDIIYEDDDCIVINKPVGVLSHSKGVFNPEATVAKFISGKETGLKGDRAALFTD